MKSTSSPHFETGRVGNALTNSKLWQKAQTRARLVYGVCIVLAGCMLAAFSVISLN